MVRSSGSIGANYIEANEKLGVADLRHKIKIARKEAKESILWISLIYISEQKTSLEKERKRLLKEAFELRDILSAILIKLQ